MNICFICHGYPPAERVGGIEVFTQTLARALVQKGHNVSVVGYSKGICDKTEEDDQGVHVLRLPQIKRGILPAVLPVRLRLESAVRKLVREHRIDLVECPDVRGSLITGRLGAPLIVRLHGAHVVYFKTTGRKPERLGPFFEKRTIGLADHLVAVSAYIRDATLTMLGLQHRECQVIYNGVDTTAFRPDPNCQRDENRILFVGRMSETKGAPNLIKALPAVFNHNPHAYLRFIGKDPVDSSGRPASDSFLSLIPETYRSRIQLVGELPHDRMPREYQEASIAVFPSRAEAHPIAVLEAMACATPTIFMSNGPGPEMIQHELEGLLCDTSSPQAIGDAILEVFRNPHHAQRMGSFAAERIISKLSLENGVVQNERFYSQCIEK